MNIILFALQNGCPWSTEVPAFAAASGHLKVLKLLRDFDCPWDAEVIKSAKHFKKYHIMKWAIENGCPGAIEEDYKLVEENADAAVPNTVSSGDGALVDWSREQACPTD